MYIYDISSAEKPKILTVLQNNKKGSIRSLHIDPNRNYLFTASFDDGELNVFDLDKPGREKYAKMNATLRGKEKVRAITWAPKRAEIVSGYADGTITFWNAVEGKSICKKWDMFRRAEIFRQRDNQAGIQGRHRDNHFDIEGKIN